MAVIHISESEFVGDYAALLDRARAGEDIVIDGVTPLRLVRERSIADPAYAVSNKPRLISDILAELEKRGSTLTLPAGFGDAVEEGIQSHQHEVLIDPWA